MFVVHVMVRFNALPLKNLAHTHMTSLKRLFFLAIYFHFSRFENKSQLCNHDGLPTGLWRINNNTYQQTLPSGKEGEGGIYAKCFFSEGRIEPRTTQPERYRLLALDGSAGNP